MTMFTGLARVAKKTGFPVAEVAGWKKAGHGGMTSCKTIVIHHTAGADNGKDYNSYGTVKNGRPGLPGPLAQLGIGRNTGTIYVFAAGKSWHAGAVGKTAHNNDNAIGIEIENNGRGEKYGTNVYNSAVALAGELVQEFGLTVDDVLGHKEIAVPKGRKVDPSFSMDKFRDDVRAYIAGDKVNVKPAATVKPKPATKPKPLPEGYDPKVKSYQDRQLYYPGMLRDGVDGPMNKAHRKWVIELQAELNKWKSGLPDLIKDGDYAGLTGERVKDVQRRNFEGAYRKAGGRVIDKIAGPVTCKMLGIRKHPSA